MIVLFTDFGLEGPYTGQVLAVLQQTAPAVPAVSLFADLPPGQPKPAAYLLATYARWFPPDTVFLCVVDPGVGSERRALIAEADGRFYVGPDNGLFEIVLRRAEGSRVWEANWRPAILSASFHGRDLFAPVAARLARGEAPGTLGEPLYPTREPDWPDDLAEIVYIDRYGNAITGLRGEIAPAAARIFAGGRPLPHANTFSAVPPGSAFWYVNSNGLVEIAVNQGRAEQKLRLAIGSPISVEI
ncbi:MAG: SAM-dependent chlorinase/fluorinase [Alphaproteobacteria bacterium]|nr:SAM-dependent chlorinase/fluorinase [Alphaproteobacteria bacterium]